MYDANFSRRATRVNPAMTPNDAAGYVQNPYTQTLADNPRWAQENPNVYRLFVDAQQNWDQSHPSGGGAPTPTAPQTPINPPPTNPPPLEPAQVINAPIYDSGPGSGDTWMTENAFEESYNTIAPALWDQYERSVENPTINRFAGSGSLGSAVGGLSGAAADVLQSNRTQAGNSIANQAYTAAQAPLLQQMTGDQQAAAAQYQGGLGALLAQYAAQANAASAEATQPYQATISQLEYPYQIFPGMFGGSMSQPVTTSGGGGKK